MAKEVNWASGCSPINLSKTDKVQGYNTKKCTILNPAKVRCVHEIMTLQLGDFLFAWLLLSQRWLLDVSYSVAAYSYTARPYTSCLASR